MSPESRKTPPAEDDHFYYKPFCQEVQVKQPERKKPCLKRKYI